MIGDAHLRRRSNSSSRSSKPVHGSESSFSLGPQPSFRLPGPVKSSPKMPHPDSGERPSDATSSLLDSLSSAATEHQFDWTNPCRESRLLSARSRLNGAKSTDTD